MNYALFHIIMLTTFLYQNVFSFLILPSNSFVYSILMSCQNICVNYYIICLYSQYHLQIHPYNKYQLHLKKIFFNYHKIYFYLQYHIQTCTYTNLILKISQNYHKIYCYSQYHLRIHLHIQYQPRLKKYF